MTKANKELEDGSFEVRIPLSEKLKGKDLVAYYVDDNGNKEEHEVTNNEENKDEQGGEKDDTPKTGTGILAIESILGIFAVVLASAVIIAKRENK